MAKCNRWTLRKCSSSQHDSREGGKEAGNKDKMKGKIAGGEEQHRSLSFTWLNSICSYKTKERGIPSPTFLFFVSLTVWGVVNILSPPLADEVKGVCCSPGQWRPHFYMWTAVNTTEWHTTKVGCAAALSFLNGTLAFNFTRVSGTHTLSSISSQNVCVSVCFYQFPETGSKAENFHVRQRQRAPRVVDKTGRSTLYFTERLFTFWLLIMLMLNGLSV